MTDETSPDWLPTGWTQKFRFQKTGRRITHYFNLATGQKFFTKDELIRYTKTVITQCNELQPSLRQTKMPSANVCMNPAVIANEHPEWLPKNWFMELKTFQSGAKIGKCYKVYVDSSTGFRFYSKPQVFQFLNNAEQKSSKSKQKETASYSTSKTAVEENERPEWLPKNWVVELKTHKSGAKIGKQYKIYLDPSTGFRFQSKPQVFRFLKNVEQKSSKSKRKGRASHSTSNVKVEKSTVDDLPVGWIKEVKIKRNANGVRRDPYYIDPATGYVFRSKRGALRYLETGEISRDAFLPKKHSDDQKSINNEKSVTIERSTVDDLPAGWIKEVKIRKHAKGVRRDPYYIDPATGYAFRSKKGVLRYLETGEISRDAFLPKNHSNDQRLISNENTQLPEAKRQKVDHPPTRQQLFKGGETSDRSILSHVEGETFEKGQSKEDPAETRLAAASVPRISEGKVAEEIAIKWKPETAEKSSWSSSVAPKASKKNQSKIVSANNMLVSTAAADVLQVKNLLESGTEKSTNINFKNSGRYKNKKELYLPRRFSKRLAELELLKSSQNEASGPCVLEDEAAQQLNSGSNAEVAKQAYADSIVKPHRGLVKKTVKPIEDKDVYGKQPQEAEKTSDTKSEIQPFSDPCLESAFKTIEGAIPLDNASNEGIVPTSASIVLRKKNLGKTRIKGKSCDTETKKSSKSRKMKKLDLPPRSSKRLAGSESKLVADRVSIEVAHQNASTRCGRNELKLPCVLTDKATWQQDVGARSDIPNQGSVAAVDPEINTIKPQEDRTISGERQQILGTEKGSGSNSELEPIFCSDPCLEFAIKTLTGAIPLEYAINEGLVSTPIPNIHQQENLAETRKQNCSYRKALFKTNRSEKKDHSLPYRYSKRLSGHEPELVANSLTNERVPKRAARKACNSKAIRNADLTAENLTDKAYQQLKVGPIMALEHHDFTYRTTGFHADPSKQGKDPHQSQTVPREMNNENLGMQSAIPFRNSLSDPCFEFAFKTVTSSAPAEDNFAFHNHLHGSSGTQRDGNFALPDYGLPNISSHLDATAPVVLQQQFPVNPSFPPPGNVSSPSCSRTVPQQPYKKGSKDLPGKV